MRIAEVIGSVTLSLVHPNLRGARLALAIPLNYDELSGERRGAGDALVVYDDLGASPGALIALSEGGEAAQPFYPDDKPVDAYNAAILDDVTVAAPLNP